MRYFTFDRDPRGEWLGGRAYALCARLQRHSPLVCCSVLKSCLPSLFRFPLAINHDLYEQGGCLGQKFMRSFVLPIQLSHVGLLGEQDCFLVVGDVSRVRHVRDNLQLNEDAEPILTVYTVADQAGDC
jgi:hypothetical protein